MTDFDSHPLGDGHDIAGFDCGVPSLNTWLTGHAWLAQRAGTARTYVWTRPDDLSVVAYYSIAPTQLLRADVTSGQAGGAAVIPAYLLGRLALDQRLHGTGLGTELLLDAVETICRAARTGGGRLIVVDALGDDAARFYHHHGFHPVVGNPYRLVAKIATFRKALDIADLSVTADAGAGLISLVMDMPDGRSVPIVVSSAEARQIARVIRERVDASGDPGTQISFRAVVHEVLGRDPFGE